MSITKSSEFKNLTALMPPGVEAVFYDLVSSTNDVAREKAIEKHNGPIWVGAAAQSSGRGRLGRVWVSEKGNLYASLMIRLHEKPENMMALPFLVALAVRQALIKSGATEDKILCKWPNDILLNKKKVAGVLIESSIGTDGYIDYIIIGIGTNLTLYPLDSEFPATSFAKETRHFIEPEDYFMHLADAFNVQWHAWLQFGFEPIRQDWLRYSWGLGEKRRIRTSTQDIVARLVSLDKDGALIIKLDDGSESRLYAGDVFPSDTSG